MVTTIDSLPPELLLRIAELRVASLWAYPRNAALKTLSLTSRAWRMPAQTLLHEYVFIKTPECAERLVRGQAPGQFHTRELDVVGNSHLTAKQTAAVVQSRIGVRVLCLRSFHELQEDVLYEPSLADLSSLILENTLQIVPTSASTFRHPFSLTSLTLDSLALVPTSLVASLFLSSPRLESLTITIHPNCVDLLLAIEAALPAVTPSLLRLATSFLTPTVLRCAGRLAALEHSAYLSADSLEAAVRSLPINSEAPPPLRTLVTAARDWTLGRELLCALALPACALLELLELRACTADELARAEWGADLVAVCKKRDIALRLGPTSPLP